MLSFTVIEDGVGLLAPDVHSSRISFPTCKDLGIPHDQAMTSSTTATMTTLTSSSNTSSYDVALDNDVISKPEHHHHHHQAFKIHGLAYETQNPKNPFSPLCRIPLPNPLGCYEYGLEPAFIRKRNERERERVKCVNEGYAKLRQHLPLENKDKRISKVETLRGAIKYINHLQTLLLKDMGTTLKENLIHEQNNNATLSSRKRRRGEEAGGEEEESEEGSELSSAEEADVKRLCTFDLGDDDFDTDSD